MKATLALAGVAALFSACATGPMMMKVDNAALPEAVRVPAGQNMKMAATGVGMLTYECREKAAAAGQFEWALVGPVATLYSADKRAVGKYYAGPTWESSDGSKITGKQVAVAPSAPGNIPMQLVKADPAMGAGAMMGVNYVQRVTPRAASRRRWHAMRPARASASRSPTKPTTSSTAADEPDRPAG